MKSNHVHSNFKLQFVEFYLPRTNCIQTKKSFQHFMFLAYFQILKKYAIVRALSVRLSVDDSTPQGIDRPRCFAAQSIAYGPRTWTNEGIFCRTDPEPERGILVKISLYFHVKIKFLIIIQDLGISRLLIIVRGFGWSIHPKPLTIIQDFR